jgi:hypothetical protein
VAKPPLGAPLAEPASALLGREAGPGAAVDLGLADPLAERLGPDAELMGDAADGALFAAPLDRLHDQPDGALLDLRWIATRAWVGGGIGHGLHLPSKRWSLHQSQGGSRSPRPPTCAPAQLHPAIDRAFAEWRRRFANFLAGKPRSTMADLPHMKRVELVYVFIEADHERVETTRRGTGSLGR